VSRATKAVIILVVEAGRSGWLMFFWKRIVDEETSNTIAERLVSDGGWMREWLMGMEGEEGRRVGGGV